jgi:hypothetical protein
MQNDVELTKKEESVMKSLLGVGSNKPLRPHRTITPSNEIHRGQFYAPSYQEQKALAAMSAGNKKEAIDWYDRAILDDPDRGHRIFSQCVVYGYKPCQSTYSLFDLNLRDVERMKKDYREGLLNVCYRSVESGGESYKKAIPMRDELMERVHLWDSAPPQYSSTPATSVAPEQTNPKNSSKQTRFQSQSATPFTRENLSGGVR